MADRLPDNEIRDITKMLEAGKPLDDKYRYLLFKESRQVELLWNGKTTKTSNIVLPFQSIEHIDEPRSEEAIEFQRSLFDTSGQRVQGWANKLIWGDNKFVLSSLQSGPLREEIESNGGIKLIYIDPPFDVGADFNTTIDIGDSSFDKAPTVLEEIAFRDTWGKGQDSFLAMIYDRLKLMHSLLANDGSIFVHIDWRLNSSMRLVLDEIFGKENFRSEINWEHQGSWVEPKNNFPKRSQQILYYTKTAEFIFNRLYEEIKTSKGVVQRWKNYIKDNKIFADNAPYQDGKFEPYVNRFIKENNREPSGKDVIVEFKGRPVGDSWYVPNLNPISSENLHYPTQKPEKLLE